MTADRPRWPRRFPLYAVAGLALACCAGGVAFRVYDVFAASDRRSVGKSFDVRGALMPRAGGECEHAYHAEGGVFADAHMILPASIQES